MAPIRCPNPSSSAKLFVQLSLRHQSRHSRPAPLLDLLLPAVRAYHCAGPVSWRQSYDHGNTPTRTSNAFSTPRPIRQRPFSTTPSRLRTQAVYNPQQDEDGNDMILEITPRAAKRLSEIMIKDHNPNLALRIQVESGGCHGFQYLMSLVTLPPSLAEKKKETEKEQGGDDEDGASGVVHEDDTIFTYSPDDAAAPGDAGNKVDLEAAPKIILDAPSLELLKGSKVDFTMELIGSQFKIVDNPLATSSCGCGTSFDIKI